MKKALLSTTALIAASAIGAVAASPASAQNEKISLRLGGYMEQWIGYSSQDDVLGTDTSGPIQASDTEVFFLGKTTLDNGSSFGVNIQLEGNTTGDTIDESYLTIGGDFGLVYIGDEPRKRPKLRLTNFVPHSSTQKLAWSRKSIFIQLLMSNPNRKSKHCGSN